MLALSTPSASGSRSQLPPPFPALFFFSGFWPRTGSPSFLVNGEAFSQHSGAYWHPENNGGHADDNNGGLTDNNGGRTDINGGRTDNNGDVRWQVNIVFLFFLCYALVRLMRYLVGEALGVLTLRVKLY